MGLRTQKVHIELQLKIKLLKICLFDLQLYFYEVTLSSNNAFYWKNLATNYIRFMDEVTQSCDLIYV